MQSNVCKPPVRPSLLATTLLFTLLLIFTACGTVPDSYTTTTSPPAVTTGQGPQPCPAAVSSPTHWDPIVGKQSDQPGKVETVSCGSLMGQQGLQALVTFRFEGTGHYLLALVYDKILDPLPVKIFTSNALEHGDAIISRANTLLTAQTDDNSSLNKGQPNIGLQRDLFREFQWTDSKQTFLPLAFPGLYPDLTRYQAEQDQAEVSQGKDAWKLDAVAVGKSFAQTFLHWPDSLYATVVSGGGPNDAEAGVDVIAGIESHAGVQLRMQRLDKNIGIWEVVRVAVDTPATSITSPKNLDRIGQPLVVTGTGSAVSGLIGTIKVLDHLYTTIGEASAQGVADNGDTTFSTTVAYTSSFKEGLQEGIVALYSTSGTNGGLNIVTMVKVLIS